MLSSREISEYRQNLKRGLPLPGTLDRPSLVPGDLVYTMHLDFSQKWVLGQIRNKIPQSLRPEQNDWYEGEEYNVILLSCPNPLNGENDIQYLRPAKYLAYERPATVRLEVGTRVIAILPMTQGFHSGTIGEHPRNANSYRYLVFFDDGSASYCEHHNIRVVCWSSNQVADDIIYHSTQNFVKSYLADYPKIYRLQLSLNQEVYVFVESNDQWEKSSVLEVDASLVLLQYNGSQTEWVYRGSPRLAPINKLLQNCIDGVCLKMVLPIIENIKYEFEEVNNTTNPTIQSTDEMLPPEANLKWAHSLSSQETLLADAIKEELVSQDQPQASEGEPVLENSVMSAEIQFKPCNEEPEQKDQIALCSEAEPLLEDQMTQPKEKKREESKSNHMQLTGTISKRLGTFKEFCLKNLPHPAKFHSHQCDKACVLRVEKVASIPKPCSPFIKPLYFGFQRFQKRSKERNILYKTPCGRLVASPQDTFDYLQTTGSCLTIDLFCFDRKINILREFTEGHVSVRIEDYSRGLERVPISCVNEQSFGVPAAIEYVTDWLPAPGVPLRIDPDFLVACDCQDDCQDPTKCHCHQLPVQGDNYSHMGYQWRRLYVRKPNGIFECNSRCKCSQKCLNRVVQLGISCRLQLFKDEKKGWGVRCLHDIPHGTFISTYEGKLLNEQQANEEGELYGDQYLIDLDHIENAEKEKAGYESKAMEISEFEDDISFISDADDPLDQDFEKTLPFRIRAQDIEFEDTWSPQRLRERKSSVSEMQIQEPENLSAQTHEKYARHEIMLERSSVRKFFGPGECDNVYAINALTCGNIGRYFNHSCMPNMFVQNVFLDTHDLRFPKTAFFASKAIPAGTELTFDYGYMVGMVRDKVLTCHCGTSVCKGRLL